MDDVQGEQIYHTGSVYLTQKDIACCQIDSLPNKTTISFQSIFKKYLIIFNFKKKQRKNLLYLHKSKKFL